MINLRAWYIETYKDRFFVQPTAWFKTYVLLEGLYHVPLSVWAIGAIVRGWSALIHISGAQLFGKYLLRNAPGDADHPLVPLHLLVWSVETAISTLTCVVEAMSWEDFTGQEKVALAQLYVPYLALCMFSNPQQFDEKVG